MEEKNNKGLYIIIIFLVILLLGVSGYLIYDKVLSNKVLEQPNSNETNKSSNDNKDEIITPDDNLLRNYQIIIQTWQATKSDYLVDKIFTKNIYEISDYDKLELILNWNSIHSFNKIDDVFASKIDKTYLSNDGANQLINDDGSISIEYNGYVHEDDVLKLYNSIFGKSSTNLLHDLYYNDPVTNEKISSCPGYYYDSKNKVYYVVYNCGGTNGLAKELNYAYKYTKEGNEYNVYIAVGDGTYKGLSDDIMIITRSHENNSNIYKEYNIVNSDEKALYDKFSINDSNYNEFDHYKMTFEKDNEGNYLFKSIVHVD